LPDVKTGELRPVTSPKISGTGDLSNATGANDFTISALVILTSLSPSNASHDEPVEVAIERQSGVTWVSDVWQPVEIVVLRAEFRRARLDEKFFEMQESSSSTSIGEVLLSFISSSSSMSLIFPFSPRETASVSFKDPLVACFLDCLDPLT